MKTHDAAHAMDAATTAAERTRNRRALAILPLLALFLVHPLIVHGCSCGHDFDFHLLNWFEAATQICHGNLHPQWAFTPAWDAGEPRFVFYPPLSWYFGALIGLALTHLPRLSGAVAWSAVPIVFTWTALTLSGLTMYRTARRYAGANAALIAAAIYMANPYMLFTAYERTAYGELLAAAWMPLLLDGILRKRVTILGIALPVALLWLTNAPAALMGCYALALLAIVRFFMHKASRGETRSLFAGTALGLGLTGFYIVPAAYDRRYVQTAMATIGGMKIDANYLFQHTGNTADDLLHDQVLRTASWIAIFLLIATAVALLAAWRRNRSFLSTGELPIALLATLTLVVAYLLTPLSTPVWHHAPEMAFLQFPWRLLAVLTPVLALAIAAALPSLPSGPSATAPSTRTVLAALLIAALLGLPAWHLFHQPCDLADTAQARLALFHSSAGTDPTDEYTPVTADNDALRRGNPPYWLADSPDAAAPTQTPASGIRTVPIHSAIDAPHAEFLILNLRDYPAWRIALTRSGTAPQVIADRSSRDDGLIAIPVPGGPSAIDIQYAQTTEQTAGDAISLASLGILAIVAARKKSLPLAGPQPT